MWSRYHEDGENCINGELHDLFSSPDMFEVIKQSRMTWVGMLHA